MTLLFQLAINTLKWKYWKYQKSRGMVHSRNASESHHERGTAACQVYRTKTDKTPPSAGQWNIFCQRSQYFPGQTEHGSVGCIQSPRFVRRLEAAADLKQESRWDLRIVRLHSLLASPPPIDIHQLIWDLCSASLVKLSTNLHEVSRCSEKSLTTSPLLVSKKPWSWSLRTNVPI